MKAVVTGDIIESTNYSTEELEQLLNVLHDEFQHVKSLYGADFNIFRGDSFQGVVNHPAEALNIALLIKVAVNKTVIQNAHVNGLPDLKIAIGIGKIDLLRSSILESNGEAFQFSGRTLDTMKGDYPRILLKTRDKSITEEFNVHFALFDSITSKWSTASAEVVYYLHKGYKEREIAETLGINQSAVNQRKKVANWDAVALMLRRYEQVMKTYTYGE
jgi:predicted DNA-binding protein YlxM (UPF0122 family)